MAAVTCRGPDLRKYLDVREDYGASTVDRGRESCAVCRSNMFNANTKLEHLLFVPDEKGNGQELGTIGARFLALELIKYV